MSRDPGPTMVTDVPDLAPRRPETHKGQVGRVVIVAGARGMSGAAVLCGLGALRGGAGLVRVLTPEDVWPIVAAAEPCLMVCPLDEGGGGREPNADSSDASSRPQSFPDHDVLAIGPGLGQHEAARALVGRALQTQGPLVLDADGLNLAAALDHPDRPVWAGREGRATVLTPHPGEMGRLRRAAGMSESKGSHDATRTRSAHEYARYSGATVVLKGHRTVVCTADRAYVNTTGNPGMATGGMGDVLTGLIAALFGQGLDAFDAARLGVFTHGLAGDRCAERIGPTGYLARELADQIPAALDRASRPRVGFR